MLGILSIITDELAKQIDQEIFDELDNYLTESKDCDCDLKTVLMIKGCQCGGK